MGIRLACHGAGNPKWSTPLHASTALLACERPTRDHQNGGIPAQQRQRQSWKILGKQTRLDSGHLGYTGSHDMRASQKGQSPMKYPCVSAASLERWVRLLLTWFSACLLYAATCMLSALCNENPSTTTYHICWQINAHTLSCVRSKSLHYNMG